MVKMVLDSTQLTIVFCLKMILPTNKYEYAFVIFFKFFLWRVIQDNSLELMKIFYQYDVAHQ